MPKAATPIGVNVSDPTDVIRLDAAFFAANELDVKFLTHNGKRYEVRGPALHPLSVAVGRESSPPNSARASLSDDEFQTALNSEFEQLGTKWRDEDRAEELREQRIETYRRLAHLGRFASAIGRLHPAVAIELNRAIVAGADALDVAAGERLEQAAAGTLNELNINW